MQIITKHGKVVGVTTDGDEVDDLAPDERITSVPGDSVLVWQERSTPFGPKGWWLVEEDGSYPPRMWIFVVTTTTGKTQVEVRIRGGWRVARVEPGEMPDGDLCGFAEALLCEAWL